jgi:hypothetical protein
VNSSSTVIARPGLFLDFFFRFCGVPLPLSFIESLDRFMSFPTSGCMMLCPSAAGAEGPEGVRETNNYEPVWRVEREREAKATRAVDGDKGR